MTVVSDEMLSSDGYRLLWYHSTKKADHDARYRARSLQRAIRELTELRERLSGPRTRFKSRKKVDEAVQEIVKRLKEESLLVVTVEEREEGTFRQASKGRPGKNTKYVKEIKKRFEISWSIDQIRMAEAEATDGIFPLISNVNEMTPEEILQCVQTSADHRETVLSIEDRFRGGSDLSEVGDSHPGLAGGLLSRIDRANVAGTRTASSDGAIEDQVASSLSGRASLSMPDCAQGDRSLRRHSAPRAKATGTGNGSDGD